MIQFRVRLFCQSVRLDKVNKMILYQNTINLGYSYMLLYINRLRIIVHASAIQMRRFSLIEQHIWIYARH